MSSEEKRFLYEKKTDRLKGEMLEIPRKLTQKASMSNKKPLTYGEVSLTCGEVSMKMRKLSKTLIMLLTNLQLGHEEVNRTVTKPKNLMWN